MNDTEINLWARLLSRMASHNAKIDKLERQVDLKLTGLRIDLLEILFEQIGASDQDREEARAEFSRTKPDRYRIEQFLLILRRRTKPSAKPRNSNDQFSTLN